MTSYIMCDVTLTSVFWKMGEGGPKLYFWRGGSDGLDPALPI